MNSSSNEVAAVRGHLYRAFWRWHFFAGLLVIPFLMILATTGMVMLLSKPLENVLYEDLRYVSSGVTSESRLPASRQLDIVTSQYPDHRASLYIPPNAVNGSSQFFLTPKSLSGGHGHSAPGTTVYVNPYSGEILGELDPATTPYARIKTLHGTLYMGNIGDSLIEIAAGLAILMILTGVYLAWPVDGWKALLPAKRLQKRAEWRRLHGFIGLVVAVPLLMFLLSGLAWTNIWGGKLVQAWSSLSVTSYSAPPSENAPTHDSMNQHGQHQVPWTLEQTPMPASGSHANAHDMNIDQVLDIASAHGMKTYRVHIPDAHKEVWTLSSTTIAGDTRNPSEERTLHLDRASGEVLADIRFDDYPLAGKAMAAFIPLHQGELGNWNLVLNLLICTLVLVMICAGFVLWMKRVGNARHKLAAPVTTKTMGRGVVLAMLVVALCFPLSAAVIAAATMIGGLWSMIAGNMSARGNTGNP